MSVETAANINTIFLEMAPHFVHRIEEDEPCRIPPRFLSSITPYRRLKTLGSPAARGLPSSRFESETWGKRNEGSMHVDENGEETALTCMSEWVLNQR